jgi:hypothetical protein
MDLEAYKRRLGSSNASEALVNATRQQTKALFKESPLYKVININGIDVGVRVNFENESERQILFQANDSTYKGAIAEFDGIKWMATEITPSLIFPKAKVKMCNQILKWKDSAGVIREFPCVVEESTFNLNVSDNSVKIIDGKITVTAPYNELVKSIKISQRFLFENEAFQVISIDKVTNKVIASVDKVNITSLRESDENIFVMPNIAFDSINDDYIWFKGNDKEPIKIKVMPNTTHTLSMTTKPTAYTKNSVICGELRFYDNNLNITRTLFYNASYDSEEQNHLEFITKDNETSISFNGYPESSSYSRYYKDIMLNVGSELPYKAYDDSIITGLIVITMEAVSKSDNDNDRLKIADTKPSSSGSGWGGGWT